jgi:3-dehydroquinate dehydratase
LLDDDEKLDTANKSKLKITVNETITWLDTLHEEVSKEEYEERLKKMEAVATAIMELFACMSEGAKEATNFVSLRWKFYDIALDLNGKSE